MKKVNLNLGNLTELENKALSAIINNLYAEPGFSDVDIKDIVSETGVKSNIMRGVVSSLIQKGYITEGSSFDPTFKGILYLNEEHYNLHPEWGGGDTPELFEDYDVDSVRAEIVVMSHLSDMQESGVADPNLINFIKFISLRCDGDLKKEINPYKLYEEFKAKNY